MEGKIKKKKQIFPIAVMEAVAYGHDTSIMLPDYLEEHYVNKKTGVDAEISETSENPVQNKVITEKLNEVFTSVSDGKKKIAEAITDKRVETSAIDNFSTMANNIEKISGGGDSTIYTPTVLFNMINNRCPVSFLSYMGNPVNIFLTRGYAISSTIGDRAAGSGLIADNLSSKKGYFFILLLL